MTDILARAERAAERILNLPARATAEYLNALRFQEVRKSSTGCRCRRASDDANVRDEFYRPITWCGSELPSGDLGDVRWRITGKEIRGYLVKDGANVASFSGVIAEGGAEGVVTSSSGVSGSWVWDGPVEKVEAEAPEAGLADNSNP